MNACRRLVRGRPRSEGTVTTVGTADRDGDEITLVTGDCATTGKLHVTVSAPGVTYVGDCIDRHPRDRGDDPKSVTTDATTMAPTPPAPVWLQQTTRADAR